jgi:beta-lactam-binding protein with PASTA domain
MKKIVIFVAVLLAAAPVMAVVDINAVQVSDTNEVDIVVTWSGEGSPPRAFAIDVNVSSGDTIGTVSGYHTGESRPGAKGFGIFPASFNREIDADDPNWAEPNYTPVAEPCDLPGGTLGGLGTSGITLELGSLFVGGPNRPTSPVTLARIGISGSTTICFALNMGRAGVVMEDGDVVGQAEATACTNLIGAGFTWGTSTYSFHDTMPAGDVIGSTPSAGATPGCGTPVVLDVSIGPCVVPNVVGMTQANAEASIIAAGFTVGTVGNANDDVVAAGNVISQNPTNGGNVQPCGSAVDIVVSDGPCVVPNVVDMTEAAADAALVAAGFTVTTSRVNANGGTALGDVNNQSPAAGATPGCGTAVNIAISSRCIISPSTPVSIYNDWVTWGSPACWCYSWQCRGDADGIPMGPYRVGSADLALFKLCYLKINAILTGIPNGICADFDHIPMGPYRVGAGDLTILKTYYLKPGVALCVLAPNHNFWCVPGGVCP